MNRRDRYTLPMRLLHGMRATLILGLIALGWTIPVPVRPHPPASTLTRTPPGRSI
ncbi:hypothetical protein SUS17_600 [Sphingomonas sp. S17]|jgi:hypothetical protein|uniref:Uncharacterized protein n=1 Tax=Sphingomonas paucimobilis TaxID=13689 RepID=A0A7Y2PE44_SPHPI|nr:MULTISPECIES: hypothetical protein [Sphingomonas]EGI56409.1 hypothetical protein SUS17_600 [Sphingomonas sp. S17]MBQ1479078.1 hypothetical protein [Sphingomonas sp.]MCM3678569.1 hypothetical protein [Sphingomonas paucimobilis]MDG5969597.1 hypothetical protein [Sphingomonas paucimobilis]NNG59511.1 hypothetical protein [Sphingomonas paucimobilis]